MFPPEATAHCLHLVRGPRDVCLSLAAHSAVTVDHAIAAMADPQYAPTAGSGAGGDLVGEIWGSRSGHTQSWLDAPIARLTMRYEDLLADSIVAFTALTCVCDLDTTAEAIAEAVQRTRFAQLVAQESARGFLERPAALPRFFRNWLQAGEAFCLLIAARLALAVLPIQAVLRSLRLTMEPAGEVQMDKRAAATPRDVALAVQRAARRLPLETRCLHIALAGAIILHRRRIQATVVLGVRSKDGLLKAHVWLLSAGAWRFGGSCPCRGSGVSVLHRKTGLRLRPPTGPTRPPSAFC